MAVHIGVGRPLWAAALIPALSGPLFAESIRSTPAVLAPAIVENRVQGPTEYSHVVSPAGWLVGCHGFAFHLRKSVVPNFTLDRWKFDGASSTCASALQQPDGAYEHYYFGRGPGRTAEMLPRYRELVFHDAWPGVDVRYSLQGQALKLTLLATIPGALAQVRFANAPGHPFVLEPPSPNDTERTYDLPDLPGLADPNSVAADADGAVLVLAPDSVWPPLDPDAADCKIDSSTFDKCHGLVVYALHSDGQLRSATWIRGSRYQYARHLGVDQGGNFYLAGSTFSQDFPVTPGKFQSDYAGPEQMPSTSRGVQPGGDIFLAKFHGPTGLLIHSTLLGGPVSEFLETFAVDHGGRAYLGVSEQRLLMGTFPLGLQVLNEDADALDYSAPASLIRVHSVSPDGEVAAVESLSPTSSALALLDRQGNRTIDRLPIPGEQPVMSVVRASDRSIWILAGQLGSTSTLYRLPYGSTNFQTVEPRISAGWLKSNPDGAVVLIEQGTGGFVPERARPTPTSLLLDPCPDSPVAIRYDSAGGFLQSTFLPPVAIPSGQPDPPLFSWITATPGGWLARTLDWAAPRQPLLACAFAPSSPYAVAPGSLLRLQGYGIGPETPVDLPLGPEGFLATEIQGVRVTINGLAMPIISGGPGALDLVVPQAAEASEPFSPAEVRAEKLAPPSGSLPLRLTRAAPQSLEGYRGNFVLNENGGPNSAVNPAGPGEIITLAIAGVGRLDPVPPEGALHFPTPPRTVNAIWLRLDEEEVQVLETNQIEGLPPGMVRLKLRLPALPNRQPGLHTPSLLVSIEGQYFSTVPIRLHYRVP